MEAAKADVVAWRLQKCRNVGMSGKRRVWKIARAEEYGSVEGMARQKEASRSKFSGRSNVAYVTTNPPLDSGMGIRS